MQRALRKVLSLRNIGAIRDLRTKPRQERGVALVMIALMVTALMGVAAIVIDLGIARTQAVSSQSNADFAALAGGQSLGSSLPRKACEDAVRNASSNVPDLASLSPTTFCSTMPAAACSGSSGSTVSPSSTLGKTTLQIIYPVQDVDIADPKAPGAWANDGTPCQRMKVKISNNSSTTFARILGITSLSVTGSATVRGTLIAGVDVPALWLLDPTGCTPLNVTGGSKVTVGLTGSTPIVGLIAADSDGSTCSSNATTVSASGAGTTVQAVPTSGTTLGAIKLHAMLPGATTCSAPACSQADVTDGRLSPLPVRSNSRATRAPVDWRYDCKSTYPNYNGITISGCITALPPYLSNLRTAIGASGQPSGFSKWSSTYSCNAAGTITVSGNWWIDCNGGLSIGNGTSVTFSGGNVVFDKALKMTGGSLSINTANPSAELPSSCVAPAVSTPCLSTSSAKAAWIYIRSGEWVITGGVLSINRAAVIMNSGYLQVNSSPPTWSEPTEGPFSGLSYWSELSSSKFSMAGGAGVTLSSVFFTPEARPFSLSGGGTWGQQSAQFITHSMSVSGGGNLTVAPAASYVALVSAKGLLIR